MTTYENSSSLTETGRTPHAELRRVGLVFLCAAGLWIIGVLFEVSFAATDTLADGGTFIVNEVIFYAAMTSFSLAAFYGARRGLAGGSRTGRIGLYTLAAAEALLMLSGIPYNFLGIEPAAIGLIIGGLGGMLASIAAGVGILLRGAIPAPARAIFLVYGLCYTAAFLLVPGGDGPGSGVEIIQALYWALIGASILKPGPRGWNIALFAASLLPGIITLALVVFSG